MQASYYSWHRRDHSGVQRSLGRAAITRHHSDPKWHYSWRRLDVNDPFSHYRRRAVHKRDLLPHLDHDDCALGHISDLSDH